MLALLCDFDGVYVQLPAGAGDDDMHDLTSLYAKARGGVALVLITLAISY